LDNAAKVDKILNAWLEYIALDDYSKAAVLRDVAKSRGVELQGNSVFIKQPTFSELQQTVKEGESGQQETAWALSFPLISNQDEDEDNIFIRPLFSLDVTSILKGRYQAEGWNIDDLKLTEAGDNLAKVFKLDEEELEQLKIKGGIRHLLNSKFGLDFEETYETWMKVVAIPRSYQIKEIKRQPYLFKFQESGFSKNLKKDLKKIKTSSKYWLKQRHPAYEYLFGEPTQPEEENIYFGAFPTAPPTTSQLEVLKQAKSQPMTAVQGPPGSGKTTLIVHLIAQQVVKRALRLIETGEDINNLTIVSSTNNKAVDNVIEKLKQELANSCFYLEGGNKNKIEKFAKNQLKDSLNFLEKGVFEEARLASLAQEITRIKDELSEQQNNYLQLRHQRDDDNQRKPYLQEKLQALEFELETENNARTQLKRRAEELADYAQIPIDAYERIRVRFDTALSRLSEGILPWWKRLWLWFTRSTEKNVLGKLKQACESDILQTLNHPNTSFRLEAPGSRSVLVENLHFVRRALDLARELQTVQSNQRETSENIVILEKESEQYLRELTALNNRLDVVIDDFYTFHKRYHEEHKSLFELSWQFLNQEALRRKENVKQALTLYSNFLSYHPQAWQNLSGNLDENMKALSLIFPVITCTLLSVSNMLPHIEECVDCAIIDEAGMIPQHQTFPLLVRSRKAIIVGDPLQIEPIITLSNQRREDYCQTAFLNKGLTENDYLRYSPEKIDKATTYHRAAGATGEDGNTGNGIRLMEHYRCQPSIIEYCNNIARYGLEVKTIPKPSLLEYNLIAHHVEGNIEGNVNQQEVTAIRELIPRLLNQGYSLADISIISPFKVHADALRNDLRSRINFPGFQKDDIGTIHRFQGSQKRVIILSTKVCRSQDNFSFINRKLNLLNVAVSRAEELFILVGNLYRLEKAGGYTDLLVKHIQKNGLVFDYKSKSDLENPYKDSAIDIPIVSNCQHLEYFNRAIQEVEQELIVVTPWIRGDEPKQFADNIVSALERGVQVKVVYGYVNPARESYANNDDNDAESEKLLRDLFTSYPKSCLSRSRSEGTNQRILLWDNKLAVVGSWDWLSHRYRDKCDKCDKSLMNPDAQIREETSVLVSDPLSLALLKENIAGLMQEES